MIRIQNIKAPIGFSQDWLAKQAAKRLGIPRGKVLSVTLLKQSLDARRKSQIHYLLTAGVAVAEEEAVLERLQGDSTVALMPPEAPLALPQRTFAHPPVVVGSGPAGLFAALTLARAGARPLLLERGGTVDQRREAVEAFWNGGPLDPECNVQFGEGGAGTFSDGKLTTGTKDPRIREVLRELCRCGAPETILYEAKPHIGTDLLGDTVKNIRRQIIALGGQVEFCAKFTNFEIEDGHIFYLFYEKNAKVFRIRTDHLVLATGHSARDVFQVLADEGVALEQKAFSVGVRIEHAQMQIDDAMYGEFPQRALLSAADYKLAAHLASGRSAYTFCMCPGGFVVAGASEPGGVVTNGMSLHARDGENANSALLVGVGPGDFGSDDPLAGVEFQRQIERKAFALSGSYAAPSATVGDFLKKHTPAKFGGVTPTYRPGTVFALPDAYLPPFVCEALREGLGQMGRKIKGFDSANAVLTGPETRSSSPVRMVRGSDGCSINVKGLYPCGEGAGYAGGIMSAAVDGIKIAQLILEAGAEQ